MKDFLEGKPIKHPLHPLLVHFPIALFPMSFLLDLGSFIWPEISGLVPAAFYSMALGVVTAVIASIPGFVDYTDIRDGHPAKKYATTHMVLNLLAVGIYAANLGLRYASLGEPRTPLGPFVLSLIGIILLSVSGYLGGVMVYDNGIGVGRHRRKTRTPERTIKVASDKSAKFENFVEIAAANTLHDRETLRVDVDGTVMVIAKLEGEFYAFQEFCTHRFGPLSEGELCDGKVRCPWHNSLFDMRTGKVMQGPAKTDLKTFDVQVRNGKIFVAIPAAAPKPEFIAPPRTAKRRFLFGRQKKGSERI